MDLNRPDVPGGEEAQRDLTRRFNPRFRWIAGLIAALLFIFIAVYIIALQIV
jgi:hypothetical protein